jgi:hypothetical protein
MCAQDQIPLWQPVLMGVRLGNWKRGSMAVMTCYTDAGGGPAEIVVSPATLVSTPDKWLEFERRWNDALAAHNISGLHMKEFAHFKGEYESFRWDEPRRRRLLNALLWIIEECIDYSAAVAIYIEGYNRADLTYRLSESMRPYTMGCMSCASRVTRWATTKGIGKNDLTWFFEKGDQDQNDLRVHWDIAYPDGAVDPIFLKKKDVHLSDQPRYIRPFEAADLIGYENLQAHRLVRTKQGKQVFSDLRWTMQRLMKMNGAEEWGYFGDADIQRACSEWAIPPRAAV